MTTQPSIDTVHWQDRLDALAATYHVPGAVLGILRVGTGGTDEVVQAATGVLNTETGVEATTDSLFQIGSITKVWTATLVLQLVDEGLLDLDAPIVDVLPDLRLADAEVTKQVTARHLLNHTSGIDGDVFTDTGRGDDSVERYVALLADVAQNHPLGATLSYSNSGYVLLGRVVETLTGMTWDRALRERLCAPLGLQRTVTLPEEALLHRAAVGHLGEPGAEAARAPVWGLPRSVSPAGAIASSAADVLAFARLHLTGGSAPDGTRLVSGQSAAAMTEWQADLPDKLGHADSWGLGWIRYEWDGRHLVGHDGATVGQYAFLRVLPTEGLAVVLLSNGGNAKDLYQDVMSEVFGELAGVAVPRPVEPLAAPAAADVTCHTGRYERAGLRSEVYTKDGVATVRHTVTGPLAEVMPLSEEFELLPADESGDAFVFHRAGEQHWTPMTFYVLPDGARYLHFGVRATPRVGE